MAKATVTLTVDKPCKHSIRFSSQDPKAATSSVYVNRNVPGIENAKQIVVSIEPVSANLPG